MCYAADVRSLTRVVNHIFRVHWVLLEDHPLWTLPDLLAAITLTLVFSSQLHSSSDILPSTFGEMIVFFSQQILLIYDAVR